MLSLALGLVAVRLVLGLGMAAHGAQKLFGWFGGYGLKGTGGFMESLGFRPGTMFALAAGLTELVGGLLLALGLLGPVGPALILSAMIVAIVTVHLGKGFFAANNGMELPLLFAAGALTFAFGGHGRLSADAVLGLAELWSPEMIVAVVAAGVAGALVNLFVLRRRTPEIVPAKA